MPNQFKLTKFKCLGIDLYKGSLIKGEYPKAYIVYNKASPFN